MSHDLTLEEIKKKWLGSYSSYVIGFILSLILTATAYFIVFDARWPVTVLMLVIGGLALIQAVGQLHFFLHVGAEAKPHWQTGLFLFMVLVLLIVVGGSFWIMHDLNNRVMPEMMEMHHD